MIAEIVPAGAWANLPPTAGGAASPGPVRPGAGDRRRSGFGRYAAFVGTGIALSLLLVSGFGAALRDDGSFLETLRLGVVFGSVAWVPVCVFALMPGWFVFRAIRGAVRGRWPVNLIGTAAAALAVTGVSALGAALLARATFGAVGGFGFFAGTLFAFGAPGAVVSGLLYYARGDLNDG